MSDNKEWMQKEELVEEKLIEEAVRKTDIVMTSFNRLGILKIVVNELRRRTADWSYRLIIVDNGSTDGSKEFARLNADIPILLDRNLGLEHAKNIGLSAVRSRVYIDTDNDIIPQNSSPDWLHQLLRLMDDNPDYGAISLMPHVIVGGLPGDTTKTIIDSHCGAVLRAMRTQYVRAVGGWRYAFTNRSEEHLIKSKLNSIDLKTGIAKDIRAIHLSNENWGYPKNVDHYHRNISPPIEVYSWDKQNINWETCR